MADQETVITDANPVVTEPYATTDWFVGDVADSSKYIPRAGNDIMLLNCGEEYLPELKRAIDYAKQTIYIAIWGINPEISLKLDSNSEEDKFRNVLERAAERGVKVKILCWFNRVANTASRSGGDSSLQENFFTRSWAQRVMQGKIENIQFMTRDPGAPKLGPKAQSEKAKLEQETKEQDKIVREILTDRELFKPGTALRNPNKAQEWSQIDKLHSLKRKLTMLNDLGYGEYAAQQNRIESGVPSDVGSFPTHHQKMILIDHELDSKALGFVQGFNFWSKYFDYKDHPYRGVNKDNHIQDVGLRLRGPCLIDLFHNFRQSWNEVLKTWPLQNLNDPIPIPSLNDPIPNKTPKITQKGRYSAQILRTWRDEEEYNVNKFYEQALPQINQFIYVEDQYFRLPEYARLIKKRAKKLRDTYGDNKKIYLFVVTNLNMSAKGEVDVRAHMLDELNRSDTNASESEWRETQQDKAKLQQIQEDMENAGVMVHICRLQNSQLRAPSPRRFGRKVDYKEIYVHSKLTLFDGAYLTLGSANWNQRSMFEDTELNIALQAPDNIVHQFREKIWLAHTNSQWKAHEAGQITTVGEWYDNWTDLLAKNADMYFQNMQLTMNLFPYFEDLETVKTQGIVNPIKQGKG